MKLLGVVVMMTYLKVWGLKNTPAVGAAINLKNI